VCLSPVLLLLIGIKLFNEERTYAPLCMQEKFSKGLVQLADLNQGSIDAQINAFVAQCATPSVEERE
ncbi:9335_t:CDS:2, partial [Acaulospora morrowiae]